MSDEYLICDAQRNQKYVFESQSPVRQAHKPFVNNEPHIAKVVSWFLFFQSPFHKVISTRHLKEASHAVAEPLPARDF